MCNLNAKTNKTRQNNSFLNIRPQLHPVVSPLQKTETVNHTIKRRSLQTEWHRPSTVFTLVLFQYCLPTPIHQSPPSTIPSVWRREQRFSSPTGTDEGRSGAREKKGWTDSTFLRTARGQNSPRGPTHITSSTREGSSRWGPYGDLDDLQDNFFKTIFFFFFSRRLLDDLPS